MAEADSTIENPENNFNPYEAPKAKGLVDPSENDGSMLETMDFKKLEKMYYRSHNVSGLAALMILGVLGIGFMLTRIQLDSTFMAIYIGILAFNTVSIVGIIQRSAWGRILGIICCFLMLININVLSIIIGIMGLFAFFGAPELFGPERITHKELKEVYKRRKKERKLKR